MKKSVSFFLALLVVAMVLPSYAADMVVAPSDNYSKICKKSRIKSIGVTTRVLQSYASMQTHSGDVKGLNNKFCVFNKPEGEFSITQMVDLQTLASARPSLAATYLLKGIKIEDLPKPKSGENPSVVICQALGASVIGYFANGGFTSGEGIQNICVFGDGSMASPMAIYHRSEDPEYLNIRASIRSEPLDLRLPYLAD